MLRRAAPILPLREGFPQGVFITRVRITSALMSRSKAWHRRENRDAHAMTIIFHSLFVRFVKSAGTLKSIRSSIVYDSGVGGDG